MTAGAKNEIDITDEIITLLNSLMGTVEAISFCGATSVVVGIKV